MASDWVKHMREDMDALQRQRALAGKERVLCRACNGTGSKGEPREDEYGCWLPALRCPACGGAGGREVACSPEVEDAALAEEIRRMRARRKELRKKMKEARDGR